MNAKIERINKDIDKTKEKFAEFQVKLKELERQKTELENTEIVDIVRGTDISLADLAAILKSGGLTLAASDQLSPKSITTTEQEDSEE